MLTLAAKCLGVKGNDLVDFYFGAAFEISLRQFAIFISAPHPIERHADVGLWRRFS